MVGVQLTGSQVARRYHDEVVGPLIRQRWPRLAYAAGRLGSGSDVLGLDDVISQDHDWGLRLTLLVEDAAVRAVDEGLQDGLPETFLGLPTRFATTWNPVVAHRVEVASPDEFAGSRLGIATDRDWDGADWLSVTGQSVLEVTAGPVFTDEPGRLTAIRRRLSWYPGQVWRYVVAADWVRIGEELPLLGRAGQRGDDLGCAVIAARLVGIAMHLGFLVERRWPPYPKWLGTGFAGLPRAGAAGPSLRQTMRSAATPDPEGPGSHGDPSWLRAQSAFGDALAVLLDAQRRVGLPTPAAPTEPFWDRPFRSIPSAVADSLRADITDPLLLSLPAGLGSVEQWVDNVAELTSGNRRIAAARSVLGGSGVGSGAPVR